MDISEGSKVKMKMYINFKGVDVGDIGVIQHISQMFFMSEGYYDISIYFPKVDETLKLTYKIPYFKEIMEKLPKEEDTQYIAENFKPNNTIQLTKSPFEEIPNYAVGEVIRSDMGNKGYMEIYFPYYNLTTYLELNCEFYNAKVRLICEGDENMQNFDKGDLVLTPKGHKVVYMVSNDGYVLFEDGTYYHNSKVSEKEISNERELIIYLMQLKKKRIENIAARKNLYKYIPDYFTDKDVSNIRRNWIDEDARRVLDILKEEYKIDKRFYLNSRSCPYCSLLIKCEDCDYGIEHGVCGLGAGNHYSQIISLLSSGVDVGDIVKNILNKYDKFKEKEKDTPIEMDYDEFIKTAVLLGNNTAGASLVQVNKLNDGTIEVVPTTNPIDIACKSSQTLGYFDFSKITTPAAIDEVINWLKTIKITSSKNKKMEWKDIK